MTEDQHPGATQVLLADGRMVWTDSPEGLEQFKRVEGHIQALERLGGSGQVIARRGYLEDLQRKEGEGIRNFVQQCFLYRWTTAQEAAKKARAV